jgi:hypothetical protein
VECDFGTDSWVVLSPIEQRIKAKIEAAGTPLREWDINIYRGVLTGCNEAFIIDEAKRAELIAADPKSAEIIRPILRGRDIKRYGYDFADLYLITTFPSLQIDIEQYSAIKQYLLSFGIERLEQTGETHIVDGQEIKARKKTNNKWFETQDSIGYWEDFYKQKICWKAVGRNLAFALVEGGTFLTAPASFITSSHNEYLLAFLHSKVGQYFIYNNSDTTGAGDIMLNIQSLAKFPIPKPEAKTEMQIKNLIQLKDYQAIDSLVYRLYGLSEEEIEFIENQ